MTRAGITSSDRPAGLDTLGIAAAIVGAALFSTKPVFIKLAYADGSIDAITLLALRLAMALPFYIVIGVHAWHRAPTPSPRLVIAIMANGLLGYFVASLLDFMALEEITAQLERLVLFTYPIFVVILGAMFFGQPLRRMALPAIAIAYAGLALVFIGNMQHDGNRDIVTGTLLVLAGAFSFALFQLFGRRLVGAVGAALYTSLAMSSAAVGLCSYFLLEHPLAALAAPAPILLIAFLIAIFATVIPSYMINFALGRIGADGTAVVGNAGPLFTIAMSALILGEPFGPLEAAGATLVIAGMVMFSRR
ncbi:MAG: DMT family transporter [Geminicoccaceae bacterium]|nr:DMT family transporter [Geminicoccaceae bacterium]MCB9942245.1 DMT family transporter [Geminicoccaceae bacterium]